MVTTTLTKEQERLAKLWDAYEAQEKEYDAALKKISVLESKLKEKEQINDTLRKVIEARDNETRELEIKVASLEQTLGKAEPKIEELTRQHREEKNRYAKLFAITEELEEELAASRRELEARDEWYKQNLSLLGNLSRAIADRSVMIDSAKEIRKRRTEDINTMAPDTGDAPGTTVTTPETVTFKRKEENEIRFERTGNVDLYTILKEVPGMDAERAKALKDAGFDTVDRVKEATTRELASVEGISPTLARKVKTEVIGSA